MESFYIPEDDTQIRLNKDLIEAAKKLSIREVRYLVDTYYQHQEYRKRAANQVRDLSKFGEPHSVTEWLFKREEAIENQIKRALNAYASSSLTGEWAMSIVGIGPVITAGLLSHIDIEKAPTVGHIWRFAGLDPTMKWEKKTKRPWNAELKRLCWIIGECFVKTCNHPNSFYGPIYIKRKMEEITLNEQGKFAEQAAQALINKKIGKDTEAYKHYSAGRLPDAHIHARACRFTVKLFLSHYHEKAYRFHFGSAPAKPFAISILNHAHYIAPPE